jgi:putative Mn2+ efflux pump MntP
MSGKYDWTLMSGITVGYAVITFQTDTANTIGTFLLIGMQFWLLWSSF